MKYGMVKVRRQVHCRSREAEIKKPVPPLEPVRAQIMCSCRTLKLQLEKLVL